MYLSLTSRSPTPSSSGWRQSLNKTPTGPARTAIAAMMPSTCLSWWVKAPAPVCSSATATPIETALAAVQAKKAGWTAPDLTREISNALPDHLGLTERGAMARLLDLLTEQALTLTVPLDSARPGDEVLPAQYDSRDHDPQLHDPHPDPEPDSRVRMRNCGRRVKAIEEHQTAPPPEGKQPHPPRQHTKRPAPQQHDPQLEPAHGGQQGEQHTERPEPARVGREVEGGAVRVRGGCLRLLRPVIE